MKSFHFFSYEQKEYAQTDECPESSYPGYRKWLTTIRAVIYRQKAEKQLFLTNK